jgi:hypothetical protein
MLASHAAGAATATAMIGLWGAHASAFLVVAAGLTIAFAAPMLIAPLAWARALGWSRPPQTDLAVYFGRCLGGVVTMLAVFALVAAARPSVQPFFFELMLAVVGLNALIHVYGAVRRIQPRSETVEIAVWVALFAAALLFFPG